MNESNFLSLLRRLCRVFLFFGFAYRLGVVGLFVETSCLFFLVILFCCFLLVRRSYARTNAILIYCQTTISLIMWCKIIIADAREALEELPSNHVDLIITSPPYFALKKYMNHPKAIDSTSIEGYSKDLEKIFSESYRVMKEGSFLCVVIGQYTSKNKSVFIPGILTQVLEDIGFSYKREHIWVKPKGTQGIWNRGTTQFLKNPFPRNAMINIQHEHVLIFQKGINRIEKTEKLTEREVKQYCWSIWTIPVSFIKGHPAPFPEELVKRLVKLYSYKGEIVMDPFLGSAVTAKVALELDRNFIGIEVDPGYLELIKKTVGLGQQRLLPGPRSIQIIRYDLKEPIYSID